MHSLNIVSHLQFSHEQRKQVLQELMFFMNEKKNTKDLMLKHVDMEDYTKGNQLSITSQGTISVSCLR